MPEKRRSPLSIFIPISILSDVPSLIEKTFKVGQIARSAAIFRVDRIVIYKDSPAASKEDAFIIRDLLSYAETPQYLRKRVFPMMDTLRYAGLIPPLRTPHHPLESTDVPYREGFVLNTGGKGSRVDVGLRDSVECASRLQANSRVTMKRSGDSWVPVSRAEVPLYWGYITTLEFKSLTRLLESEQFGFGSVIITSRLGKPLGSVAPQLAGHLSSGKAIAVVFGTPAEGVHEILSREGKSAEEIADLIVNTVPDQGAATVRTEEAVTISLAAFSAVEALTTK